MMRHSVNSASGEAEALFLHVRAREGHLFLRKALGVLLLRNVTWNGMSHLPAPVSTSVKRRSSASSSRGAWQAGGPALMCWLLFLLIWPIHKTTGEKSGVLRTSTERLNTKLLSVLCSPGSDGPECWGTGAALPLRGHALCAACLCDSDSSRDLT